MRNFLDLKTWKEEDSSIYRAIVSRYGQSDYEDDTCEKYKVWVEKSMYGKKYFGIERTTFLIDKNNKILHVWNKVKVANHLEEILSFLK